MNESNKLIAEFMGLIIRDKEGNLPTCSQQHKLFVAEEWDKLYLVSPFSPNGLDYHKSWDYLMTVVDKIENMGCEVVMTNAECTISGANDYYVKSIGKSRIGATYLAVVEFIKSKQR
mgnify:CR=1 FL=1|tara:strand:- start:1 stop:351 length:351 start_codon:yes stop_codon:yes gene_type:complete